LFPTVDHMRCCGLIGRQWLELRRLDARVARARWRCTIPVLPLMSMDPSVVDLSVVLSAFSLRFVSEMGRWPTLRFTTPSVSKPASSRCGIKGYMRSQRRRYERFSQSAVTDRGRPTTGQVKQVRNAGTASPLAPPYAVPET
jgi:hypothetical protein